MATQASLDKVQQFYVAYYGRPADPTGQEAWADLLDANGGDLTAIIDAFGTSPEADERFGGQTSAETIATLYQQLFGRDVESQEVQDAWVFQLENNPDVTLQSIAVDLLTAAQNDDKTVIDNKTAVANNFTAALDTQEEIDAYVGTAAIAAGNTLLNSVDATTDTAAVDVAAPIQDLVDNGGNGDIDGSTFSLTAETDTIVGTANNDLITGTSADLSSDDRITDISTTDNDVLNITATADLDGGRAMDVTNVENINVDWDAFGTADINLDNVTGATVSLSSDKSGYLGNANFTNVGTNNVTLGTGITGTVTIDAVEDATVEAGSADTVTITNADGDLTVNADNTDTVSVTGADDLVLNAATATDVTVAGTPRTADITLGVNADLSIAGATAEYTLQSGADIAVDVAGGSTFEKITIAGDNAVTLDFQNAADVNGLEIVNGGAIVLADALATTIDLEDVAHTSLTLEGAANGAGSAVTLAAGANIVADVDLTNNATFVTTAANDGANDSMTLTVKADQGGALDFAASATTDFESVTIVADADAVTGTDVTLADVQAATGTVTLQSATNEVEVSEITAGTVDATAVAGDFTLTTTSTAEMVVSGGSADNTIVLAATDNNSTFIGQSGNDTVTFATEGGEAAAVVGDGNNTVNATAVDDGQLSVIAGAGNDVVNATGLTSGNVSLNLGAGNNTVALGGTLAGVEVVVSAAEGNDTVTLTGATHADDEITLSLDTGTDTLNVTGDLTDGTISLSGVDVIDVNGNAGSVVLDAALLDGQSYTIAGEGTATDQVAVHLDTAGAVDFSNLTIDNTITNAVGGLNITGNSGNDTIVATSGNDTIASNGGNDTITGGAGADAVTGGAGTDTVVFGAGDLVAATASDESVGADDGAITDNDTITWGNGVDTIASFTAGTDKIDLSAFGLSAGSLDASNADDSISIANGEYAILRGGFTAGTGVFAADAVGNDTVVVFDADTTSGVSLVGVVVTGAIVTADDLVLA